MYIEPDLKLMEKINKTLTAKNQYTYIRKAYRSQTWGANGVPTVVVETDSDGWTFDKLTTLSELFGTTMINLGSEERSGGYCETCAYDYTVSVATIIGPTKNT